MAVGDGDICGLILAAGLSSRMGGSPKALLPLGGSTLLGQAAAALREGGVRDIRVVTGHCSDAVSIEAGRLGLAVIHNAAFARGMFSSIRAGLSALPSSTRAVLLLPVDAALVRGRSLAALVGVWRQLPESRQETTVIIPAFGNRPGHPPLIGAAHLADILARDWEDGLRGYFSHLMRPDAARKWLEEASAAPVSSPPAFFSESAPGGELPMDVPMPSLEHPFPPVCLEAASPDRPVYMLPLPDKGLICDIDTPQEYERARDFLSATRGRSRPSPEEAWVWLCRSGLDGRKVLHSLQVALGALRLGAALAGRGREINPGLHVCAGILHDIGRRFKEHARVVYAWGSAYGWEECALAAGAHTVLPDPLLEALGIPLRDVPVNSAGTLLSNVHIPAGYRNPSPELLHACVCVYLADKHYSGRSLVSVEQRFAAVRRNFAGNSRTLECISRREAVAAAVRDALEGIVEERVDALLCTACGHPLERTVRDMFHEVE